MKVGGKQEQEFRQKIDFFGKAGMALPKDKEAGYRKAWENTYKDLKNNYAVICSDEGDNGNEGSGEPYSSDVAKHCVNQSEKLSGMEENSSNGYHKHDCNLIM